MKAAEFQQRYGSRRTKDPDAPDALDALNRYIDKVTKPQIRIPAKREPNKTEDEYKRILESEFPAAIGYKVRFEPMSFTLNCGTSYRPDLIVMEGSIIVLCVEVKGGFIIRDASKEKFKQARAEWPEIEWRFAQKIKGEWLTA